ncbi:transposable element Tcb2 transposase [Trichonephila clavipes]|uniref:Transposable element Tcb2 transposase n=1 Tax=Trichonephila clavipes TaxID=2585209 RepID=A0A8X7BH67_TRICX|nr:transposable element Tcb2 transposase [Trichonephila clavipes]
MYPALQVRNVKVHGGIIMVCGVFSKHCLGSLAPSMQRGDHLHPFMLFCYPHSNGVYQQDNCTSQKSRLATGWLDEHS